MLEYRSYFSGYDSISGGYQLWVTNGTAQGTSELPIADAAASGLAPQYITVFGNSILFEGTDSAGKDNLYISDGTAAGTTELDVSGSGPDGLLGEDAQTGPHESGQVAVNPQFFMLGQVALFVGVGQGTGQGLWRTDGTAAGTTVITVPNADPYDLDQRDLTSLGSKALFLGYDTSNTLALFVTDGTSGGTQELLPNIGSVSIIPLGGGQAEVVGGSDGNEVMWITDGTTTGTHEISVTAPPALLSRVASLGSQVLFIEYNASGAEQLWITDGTTPGTRQITPAGGLAAGLLGLSQDPTLKTPSLLPSFTPLAGKLVFNAYAADGTLQMWITDGTSAGTIQLTTGGEHALDTESGIAVIGGKMVFSLIGSTADEGLWVTDGTSAGTFRLSAGGDDITALGNLAVFRAYSVGVTQLWVTDGTSAGTMKLPTGPADPTTETPAGFTTLATPQTYIGGSPAGGSVIEGTAGDDIIRGYGLGNIIYSNGGNDFIIPGAGQDTVYGPSDGDLYDNPKLGGLNETINLQGSGNAVYGGNDNYDISYGDGGNSVSVGYGNDIINLFGAGNQVTLGGGVGMSALRFTGGSTTVVLAGTFSYDVAIAFRGTGNTLYNGAGDNQHLGLLGAPGTLNVSGGDGDGYFSLGRSSGTLVTGGFDNTVYAEQGVANISPGSGHDTVVLLGYALDEIGGDDTIHLSGQSNTVTGVARSLVVTGGSGNGTFDLAGRVNDLFDYAGRAGFLQRTYSITTGGTGNSFALDGAFSNTVFAGYGNASIMVNNPVVGNPLNYPVVVPLHASSISFAGTGNTLTGGDADITVYGGSGAGSITLGDGNDCVTTMGPGNVITLGDGADSVVSAGQQAVITVGNGADTLTIAGTGNVVTAGNGDDTVTGGAGQSQVTLGDGNDVVALTGFGNSLYLGGGDDRISFIGPGNQLVAGNGNDVVTGGKGTSNVTLGNGNDTVQLGGWANTIVAGSGVDTLDGGSGQTAVTLNGSDATLVLRGYGDTVTLNSGAQATLTDNSRGLYLAISASDVQAAITNFGVLTHAVLDLTGGTGGYTSVQGVLAALHSDGNGGTRLALGPAGSVDFIGLAPSALHAANFRL